MQDDHCINKSLCSTIQSKDIAINKNIRSERDKRKKKNRPHTPETRDSKNTKCNLKI